VVLSADAAVPLPGPGLVVGEQALATKHDALKAFVAATLRAMSEIEADPQKGVDASIAAVPDLGTDPATQLAILRATIATWPNSRTGAPIGAIDRDGWTSSIAFMTKLGLVPNPVTVDQLVSADLLPAQ
jgi:ABC-type nitrate/sulfonate/bicarbonate transport system substrate-binding protein